MTIYQSIIMIAGIVFILVICGTAVVSADEVNVIFESAFGIVAQEANDVEVEGDYAYVADCEGDLLIVDISNPESPRLMGGYDAGGYAGDVAIEGDYAYISDEVKGLLIIDVSSPESPRLVGDYYIGSHAGDVTVEGNHAYVSIYEGDLLIVDISNPESPDLVGVYDTGDYVGDVAVEGDYAYIVNGSNSLSVVDISNHSSPNLVGTFDMTDHAGSIAVSDGYAYVGTYNDSLKVIDVRNSSSITTVGIFDDIYVDEVVIEGDYAYLSSLNCLVIVDISTPSSPTAVGSYATETYSFDVAVEDSHVCMTDEYHGLVILRTEVSNTTPNLNNENHTLAIPGVTTISIEVGQSGSQLLEPLVVDVTAVMERMNQRAVLT